MLNDNQLAKALKLKTFMHWKEESLFILKQLRIPQEAYFSKQLCGACASQNDFCKKLSL